MMVHVWKEREDGRVDRWVDGSYISGWIDRKSK